MIDYSNEKTLEIIFDGTHYAAETSYTGAGGLKMRMGASNGALSGLEVSITDGGCRLKYGSLTCDKPLSEFGSAFLPAMVYAFFSQTDFSSSVYDYNAEEKTWSFSATLSDRFFRFSHPAGGGADVLTIA